jgi:hypothetical protein
MASRLGQVVYWISCVLAVLWAAVFILAPTSQAQPEWGFLVGVAIVGAGVIWAVGRAIRYVLVGN